MLEIIYEKIRRYEIDKTNPLVVNYKKINDSLKQINQEIQTGVFPVSTKERLRFLYGDECARLYEEILINFKD